MDENVNTLLKGVQSNFKFVTVAVPKNATLAREVVDRFLASIFMSEDDKFSVCLAVGEAIINSCEHAYKGQEVPGKVSVRGHINPRNGSVIIEVEDAGVWTGIPPEHKDEDSIFELRGRGIELMTNLADKVRFYSKIDGGTIVIISKSYQPIIAA